jgi:hypothetical protein
MSAANVSANAEEVLGLFDIVCVAEKLKGDAALALF